MAIPALDQPEGTTAWKYLQALNLSGSTLEKIDPLIAVMGVGAVFAGKQTDELTAIKNTVAFTKDEIDKSVALAENWAVRKQIMESQWPTDPALQETLIALLRVDAQTPLPPPVPPPENGNPTESYPLSVDQIKQSTVRAQNILATLASVPPSQAAALPAASEDGDVSMAIAVGDWLEAHGVDMSQFEWTTATFPVYDSSGTVQLSGFQTMTKAQLTTPWTFPVPGVLDVGPARWVAEPDGDLHLASVTQETKSLQAFRDEGYDLSLMPSPSLLQFFPNGGHACDILTVGDTRYVALRQESLPAWNFYFANYGPITTQWNKEIAALYGKLLPDTLGVAVQNDPTSRYWSDGSKIYRIRDDLLRSFLGNQAYAATLHIDPDGGNFGAQLLGQLPARVGDVTVFETVERVPEASDAEQAVAGIERTASSLRDHNSRWTAIAQTQTLQLQEGVAKYANALNWWTNDSQRWERFMASILQNIKSSP